MSQPLPWLPEEVWEIILNNLEDSTDVWNVFRAFPQLDNSPILQKKKPLWLFGLVIPILIPWISNLKKNTRMLLSCRTTCKHWATAVDTFLENQPQLRPYDHENQNQGSDRFPWDPRWAYAEGHENKFDNLDRQFPNYIGGMKIHDFKFNMPNLTSATNLLQSVAEHPPERNPFLSRSLSITAGWGLDGDSNRYTDEEDVTTEDRDQFRNYMIHIHQIFGKHVWFYKLAFSDLHALDCGNHVADWFAQLPNLKSLHLMGSEDDSFEPRIHNSSDCSPKPCTLMERSEKVLPHLPHLETLKVDRAGKCQNLVHFLIKHLTTQAQIRRLELEFSMWKPEYSQMFQKLTELDFFDIYGVQVDVINSVLLSLQAPQLSKLQLKFRKMTNKKNLGRWEVGMEDEIFQWLKRFPMLRIFILNEGCEILRIEEKGTLLPETDSIKSLQFLSIRTPSGMSFNFLRCLPSLQILKLLVPMKPAVVIDRSTDSAVVIRLLREEIQIQIRKLHESNIWEMNTKLRTVNLVTEYVNYDDEDDDEEIASERIRASYEFCREDFEKTKGVAVASTSTPTSKVNFSGLRRDILGCLKITAWTATGWTDFYDDEEEECSDGFDSDGFDTDGFESDSDFAREFKRHRLLQ